MFKPTTDWRINGLLQRNAKWVPLRIAACILLLLLPLEAALAAAGKPNLVLQVDAKAKPGKGKTPHTFTNLPEALDSARDQAAGYKKVIIRIKAGEYAINETLKIDFPVEIQGSNKPELDRDRWPLGSVRKNSETRLVAEFCSGPLIAIGGIAGDTVSNVVIQNLTLQGGAGGCTVLEALHGRDIVIADNIFTGPSIFGIYAVGSSGLITGNYVAGMGSCGICVGAGTDAAPTQLIIADNRSIANTSGGLLLAGTSYPLPEFGNQLNAAIVHNDFSGNDLNAALGFGVRILAIGTTPDLNTPASPVEGRVNAHFIDNRISLNNHGVMIDAGEPVRNIPPGGCDNRRFTGEIQLSFSGDTVAGNLIRNTFISFTRAQVITGTAAQSRFQYLHSALVVLADPGEVLAPWVLDHPEFDRFAGGSCADDVSNEALLNSFFYNSSEVAETP